MRRRGPRSIWWSNLRFLLGLYAVALALVFLVKGLVELL